MATGAYDSNGIWKYGEDDNISLFSTTLNKLADSTSTALTSDRARLSTLEAGSLAGLIPVKPTSVTFVGGTGAVNTLGYIDITSSCTKVTVNGVFTADYSSYKIILHDFYCPAGANENLWIRMVSGGTESTTGYNWARNGVTGGGAALLGAAYAGGGVEVTILGNGNGSATEILVTKPQKTKRTNFVSTSYSARDSLYVALNGGTHDNTSSFDGFSLYVNANNLIGSLSVYGYND